VPEQQPAHHHHHHHHQAVSDNEGSDEGSDEDSGVDDSMSSNSSSTTGSCDGQNKRDDDDDAHDSGGGGCMTDDGSPSSTSAATGEGRREQQIVVKKKRVRWEKIRFRDFALVVGDHPLCQDGLPVSLAWQYNDHATPAISLLVHQQQERRGQGQEQKNDAGDHNDSSNAAVATAAVEACRSSAYAFPRRLTYEERQRRLQTVSDLTLDQIKNDEIELVVRTLNENFFDDNGDQPEQQHNEPDRRITKKPVPSHNNNCGFDFDGDVIMFDDDDDNDDNGICSKNDEAVGRFLLFTNDDDNYDDDDDDDDRFDMSSFDWGVGSSGKR